jgi:hypothetical protein
MVKHEDKPLYYPMTQFLALLSILFEIPRKIIFMQYVTLTCTTPGTQGGHEKSEEGNLRDELPNKVIISLLELQSSLLDIPRRNFGKIKNNKNKF